MFLSANIQPFFLIMGKVIKLRQCMKIFLLLIRTTLDFTFHSLGGAEISLLSQFRTTLFLWSLHSRVKQGNSSALTAWSCSHIPINIHILHANTLCKFKVNEIPTNHLPLFLATPYSRKLGFCQQILPSFILTLVHCRLL